MLRKIELKGYKSIKDLTLELDKINILIGANGSGKSNFISFFKLLRWMMQTPGQFQYFVGKSGGANSLLFDGAEVTPQLTASLEFETEVGSNEYCMRLSHAASDTFIFVEEKYRFSRNTYDNKASWKELDAGHKESKLIDVAQGVDKTAQTILFLLQNCVVYQFHNTSETARIRQRWDIEDNRYLREDGANLASFLLRIRESNYKVYSRIVQTIRLIAPFFLDFVLEPVANSVILQWREQGTDLIFSSHQASDGTLRTMALVALLLQPEQDLPSVIILDEPELGLHPYAINIVAGLLQSISHKTQIIMATQSAMLIDCFEPEDIIIVERRDRQSRFWRQNSEQLKDWLQEYSLSELWDKNVIGGRPSK
ncbi:SMC domain protein [Rippkaea orientalis PCC 8801]|uniref:SMC domain protein n=1 Tax=Rippkaea orientalis (strain PCC 8801 / RF-1) TaxID=41431 RepID=B7JWR2_RIPO1|nr:AAA family ATPase [Rippkaea orientalis]ACK64708.1 SMC domain protein [Rippkaea orientalis PCC 8801]